jgi:hypothetical protein
LRLAAFSVAVPVMDARRPYCDNRDCMAWKAVVAILVSSH